LHRKPYPTFEQMSVHNGTGVGMGPTVALTRPQALEKVRGPNMDV